MPPTTRLIDQDSGSRTRPMRLLVLGLSRTGTSSLCVALERLGYNTFHMRSMLQNPTHLFPRWIEAQKAKFDNDGQPYGRTEFDKLLGEWDAASDVPVALFADELVAAYPEAKVLLTIREPEAWVKSMQSTIYLIHSWASWDWLAPYDTFIRLWRGCDGRDWDAFIGEPYPGRRDYLSAEYAEIAKRRFDEHYRHVRKIVPKERLLEHRPQDGWKPLCEFLGHDVPEEEYPRVWDAQELVKMSRLLWWTGIAKMSAQTVLPVAGAVGVAVYWYRR